MTRPCYSRNVSIDLAPFTLVEHGDGELSLLLKEFEPVNALFRAMNSDGAGYAWEAVARHVVENVATELEERVEFDSEQSMFCAFGADRDALEALGARLARLFRDERALATIIDAIGTRGFDLFGG